MYPFIRALSSMARAASLWAVSVRDTRLAGGAIWIWQGRSASGRRLRIGHQRNPSSECAAHGHVGVCVLVLIAIPHLRSVRIGESAMTTARVGMHLSSDAVVRRIMIAIVIIYGIL